MRTTEKNGKLIITDDKTWAVLAHPNRTELALLNGKECEVLFALDGQSFLELLTRVLSEGKHSAEFECYGLVRKITFDRDKERFTGTIEYRVKPVEALLNLQGDSEVKPYVDYLTACKDIAIQLPFLELSTHLWEFIGNEAQNKASPKPRPILRQVQSPTDMERLEALIHVNCDVPITNNQSEQPNAQIELLAKLAELVKTDKQLEAHLNAVLLYQQGEVAHLLLEAVAALTTMQTNNEEAQ